MVEKRITELEDFSIESSKTKKAQRTKIGKKTEMNIQGLWDNFKRYNIHAMGIPKKKEKERKEQKKYLKQ